MRRTFVGQTARLALVLCFVLAEGDGCSTASSASLPTGTGSTSVAIGAAGGTLSGGGATLTVPAGALAATTTLSLSWGPASGGGYAYDSELFQFGPSGTSFATPAVASLPVTGDPQQAAFYWSDGQGSYQELIGRIL